MCQSHKEHKEMSHKCAHFPHNKTRVKIKPEGNKHKVLSFFMLPRTKVNPCVWWAFYIDRVSPACTLCACVSVCSLILQGRAQ